MSRERYEARVPVWLNIAAFIVSVTAGMLVALEGRPWRALVMAGFAAANLWFVYVKTRKVEEDDGR